MAEGKSTSASELLRQIDDFENTIRELQKNVVILKEKVRKNSELYGPDPSKWPKEAK